MSIITIENLKEMEIFAKKFAKILKGGEVILLNGDLGAGKTTFTKFLLKSIGVKDEITSPTFTIMRSYKCKKYDIHHFDMYRLTSGEEARAFGLEDYIYSGDKKSIVLIEWAENIKDILNGKFIEINITVGEDENRNIEINR